MRDEEKAKKIISRVIELLIEHVGLVTPTLAGREVIGGRFILYKYSLGDLGECRIIVDGKRDFTAQMTICLLKEKLEPGILGEEYYGVSRNTGFAEAPRGVIEGFPRGQKLIPKPVVYAVNGIPRVSVESWRLVVEGLVEKPLELSYEELLSLGLQAVNSMFHCVTGWSISERKWEGIPLKRIAELAKVKNNAKWVLVESLDGYTTIIPIEDFLHPQSILALRIDDKPLSPEHGFPARIFIPHLYGWKHAKWVKRIIFLKEYVDGYWEALGYHERGNIWREERFKGT